VRALLLACKMSNKHYTSITPNCSKGKSRDLEGVHTTQSTAVARTHTTQSVAATLQTTQSATVVHLLHGVAHADQAAEGTARAAA
jgi:hypothetical protein